MGLAGIIALLAALVAVVYMPGLSGHFLFDDYPNIVQNRAVQAEALSLEALRRASGAFAPGPIGRPLPMASFAVDHALWGLDAPAFKRTNLAIHVLNTALVFLLLVSVLGALGRLARDVWIPAFFVAAIWAIHPLQVSTTLYIVQRMEMLAATSVLLGLFAYLYGRLRQIDGRRGGWPLVLSSGAVAATGLLSKESAILFPLFALALEVSILRFRASAPATERWLRWSYAAGITVLAVLFLGVVVPHYADPETYSYRDFTPGQRLLSQALVLPTYLQQIVFPAPASMLFNYDHLAAPLGVFQPPTVLAGVLGMAGLASIGFLARNSLPLFSAGVLWFFAAHFLTSNVVPLELAYEHRNYLALLGIVVAGYALLQRLLQAKALLIVAVVGLFFVGFLGYSRSAIWSSAISLAMENAANNPQSARAANDLGVELAELSKFNPQSPYFTLAVKEFERGMRLPRASPLPEQGLILMHAGIGLPAKDAWWDSIDHKLRTGPIGVQERLAVSGLLERAREGAGLDPVRVERSWRVLRARTSLPAFQEARFADWLSRQPGRESDALREFAHARLGADDDLKRAIDHRLAAMQNESNRLEQRSHE